MDTIPKPEMTPPPVTPEGEHHPKHDTQELPVLKKDMRKAFRINEVLTVVVSVATAIGSLAAGYTLFIDKAEAAGQKKYVEVQAQQEQDHESMKRLSVEFTAHVETEAERGRRMEKKLNAVLDRLDVRDPAPTPKDGGH